MSTIKSSTTLTTAYSVEADTTGALVFQTGATPTTALSIDASQNVNFAGTAQRITGDFSNATFANRVAFQTNTTNTATTITILPNGTATVGQAQLYSNSDPTNSSRFTVAALSTEASLRSDISGTGTYLPMTFYTGGSESLRLSATTKAVILAGGSTSANGTGITFPATQSASTDVNTLDDYEEGTFTPTIVGVSTAGTATYTQQVGRYTKIGDRVSISIYLQWTGGTGTGNMNISGLPFTSDAAALNQSLSNYNGSVAMTAGHVMQLITGTSSTVINVNSVPSGGGADANVSYDASGLIIVGGSYEAS